MCLGIGAIDVMHLHNCLAMAFKIQVMSYRKPTRLAMEVLTCVILLSTSGLIHYNDIITSLTLQEIWN